MKIAVFYNPVKPIAYQEAQSLKQALESRALEAEITETKRGAGDWGVLDASFDLAVVLGGDGTFLLTAKQVLAHDIPLLGINFGHLGFLSEYGDIKSEELAKDIDQKNYLVESRTVLQAYVPEQDTTVYALNDIVVNRSLSSNLLRTNLFVDEDFLHSYRSDGVVICTPTGSTAYALSAGGAVMDPNIQAFQIVPIAAHSLSSRPHVISDSQTIVLVSEKEVNAPFTMQSDGQELITLDPGSKIVLKKAQNTLKLAKLKTRYRSFYSILREKMNWGSLEK